MASSISAGTTSSTALVATADTSGALVLQTNNGTTALTLSTAQNATFAGTLTTASQGIAAASMPAGSILQVVNATYATSVTTTSTSPITTGLTASITPKFATSKILAQVSIASVGSTAAGCGANFYLYRNASQILYFINNAPYGVLNSGTIISVGPSTNYLDSPATTSSTSYTVYFASDNGGSVTVQRASTTSTITLMEVAA